MNNFVILAASSLSNADEKKPHLFNSFRMKYIAIPGLSLTRRDERKNVCKWIKTNQHQIQNRQVILWHDVINNSLSVNTLSSNPDPKMSPNELYASLSSLRQYGVIAYVYLPRKNATSLEKVHQYSPITYVKMKSVLTPRYKALIDPENDMHLNPVLEAHMISRVVCVSSLSELTLRKEGRRQCYYANKVCYNFKYVY